MHETHTKGIHRSEWQRWLLYVDLLVFGVFIAGIVMLAWDAYAAGFYAAQGSHAAETSSMWALSRNVAIATGAFAWIFFRFFTMRSKAKEQKEPWFD